MRSFKVTLLALLCAVFLLAIPGDKPAAATSGIDNVATVAYQAETFAQTSTSYPLDITAVTSGQGRGQPEVVSYTQQSQGELDKKIAGANFPAATNNLMTAMDQNVGTKQPRAYADQKFKGQDYYVAVVNGAFPGSGVGCRVMAADGYDLSPARAPTTFACGANMVAAA